MLHLVAQEGSVWMIEEILKHDSKLELKDKVLLFIHFKFLSLFD